MFQAKKLSFLGTLISGLSSLIITLVSVAGFGWKIHKDIINDVTAKNNAAIKSLELRLSQEISSKLEKEPTTYQVGEQGKLIQNIQKDVTEINEKLITIQGSVNDIKQILTKRTALTQK